jgi:RNA polymerase sigma factor (sigma-70 family)
MPEEQLHPILRHLQRHFPGAGSGDLTDCQLLERFAHLQDETAFAALVQRHGTMVYGVCRRVLQRAEDAEDVFQATFLVLARKAAAVAWPESVGRWLYQVAYRLSAEARTRNSRRDALEKQAAQRRKPAGANHEGLREGCAMLDEALHGLPARYREPLVLCYLEGLTRDQAAGQLGWSLRTLERRLVQGRERLRQVLTRRGVTLSAALLASSLTCIAADAAASTRLVAATVRAAMPFATGKAGLGGEISATAAALAEGASHGTVGVPTRIVALLAVLLGLAAGGLGVFLAEPSGTEPAQASRTEALAVREPTEPPQLDETLPPRQDRLGDPLPPGAVARMGSSRLRHTTADRWGWSGGFGTVVSPDGKTLLTTSADGIRAWSLGTGKLLYQIRDRFGHHDPAFSPDGKWLAMPGKGAIDLRDPATGRKLQRLPAVGEFPRQPGPLAFSPDGRRLAAILHEGEILIFDTTTGRQAGSLDVQRTGKLLLIDFLVFAPDGRALLSMGWEAPDARLAICHWDLATQTLVKRVVSASLRFITSNKALSPDGRLLAVWPARGPVTLWDTQTDQVRCTLQGDRNRADYGLAFSADAKTLATTCADDGDRDATASLWDTTTGKLRRRLRVPRTPRLILRNLSPDGRLLLFTVRWGCRVRLWDLATGQEILEQEGHGSAVASLAFTPDGHSIVSGGNETIRVWDARTGQQRQVMVPHCWFNNQVMVRPDCRTAVSGGMDGTVRVHDLTTGREVRQCLLDREPDAATPRGNQILELGLALDGQTAATLSTADKAPRSRLHVWDLDSGRILVRRERATRADAAAFSGDARMLVSTREVQDLASGPPRTVVVLEEVSTGRELLTLPQPDHFGNSPGGMPATDKLLVLTPDGQSLLTTTFTPSPDSRPDTQGPSTLRLWELATGKQRLAITSASGGYDHALARLAVAPDGRTLATVRRDHIIQLWDLATGKEFLHRAGHDSPASCLTFSPDGKRLATGHMDGAILVWDVAAAYERRPRPRPAEARELESWWQDLGSEAPQAHRAIWGLAGVPAQALPLLRDRLRPALALPADELQRLVQDLDSPRFPRREEASRRLAEFGEEAEPTLRQALVDKPSAEARQRLEQILAGPRLIRSQELLRPLRALQILEAIGDEPARQLLGKLAEGAPASRFTREARAAVDRLAHR